MATGNSSGRNPSRNTPNIVDLEFGELTIVADLELEAVRLEITDPQGHGFAILLGLGQATDATARLIRSIHRLGEPT